VVKKKMRLLRIIPLLVPLAVFGTTADDVLSKLDQSAVKFSAMTGKLSRSTYTKVIDDKSTEEGVIALKKIGPRDMQVLITFSKPDPKTVAFRGGKAEIYYPKLKLVQEYDLGKRTDLMDQFTLVGFGTTGRDLKANYSVKYVGEESIAGQKAQKLELIPSTATRREKLQKLELWIDDDGLYPVQQKFLQPSGDYYQFTYSEVKVNPQLGDEAFKLKVPKGVKREFPQK
jgi:outer membrane lipoprotein-sorting protein